ncbi:hypothetical protein BH11ARM2_BH11ARM2_29560 [soil metagenome]
MVATLALLLAMNPATPLDASLDRFPARKAEWEELLAKTPKERKSAVEYLLTYMPLGDLRALPTRQVADAVRLAYEARRATTWGQAIPDAVFFDSVAPYAAATEPRQSMRAEFQKRYLALAKETPSPGDAALAINRILFKDYPVIYNTHRLRTDQSSPESIAQGMATCTGLSIMLIDALRAVGVPARMAGIASWPGTGGNHTWVEVWDTGRWHYIAAAEPDDKGLDRGWFTDQAARAIANEPTHAVYAVTYHDSQDGFPLAWDPGATLPAENVTARYRRENVSAAPRLMVEVKKGGERVKADVTALVVSSGDQCLNGQSLGPQADVNLHLTTPATDGTTYLVRADYGGQIANAWAKAEGDTVVRIDLDHPEKIDLSAILAERFGPHPDKAKKLLEAVAPTPENLQAAWTAYLAQPDPALKAEFDANTVKTADRTSPYKWRTVGEKPKDGWGLVIAMHGGGGAPKEVNDEQWAGMFKSYYKDHPEAGGYVYLALRAPNDEWNGFYDDAICPLVERLILQFVKYEGVDPNRVYACGASHGGYGTFVIVPKIPYRFAAAHPAASAPTDGETAGENLRNVRFTWATGENDTDYGRIERSRAFQKQWEEWQAKYGGFDGGLEEVKGHGHLIGDHERDKVAELLKSTRQNAPKKLVWTQTDDVLHRFYWLEAENPVGGGHIEASIEGNTVTIQAPKAGVLALWLSQALVDLTKPVTILRDGKKQEIAPKPSLETFCQGLFQTGDPALSGTVRVEVPF